ncbi:unnamed protein product [Cylicocyclus nassatus]|uniref:Uncharacterized protein n=1 Tax=Cylicocyclus nassatus TaxID=53992 RepID=A0AA36GSN8_CYLNA|nr:unnamed protein product [Cylicocyclus nassatus]
MNLLFFFFFLGACFLGLTNALRLTPEEKRYYMECVKNCKGAKSICHKKCLLEIVMRRKNHSA